MRLIDQACMTCRSSHEKVDVAWQCISERLWKCFVGRYGGCFEERYKEAYDDRAYRAKGLDVPAKVDANSWIEKKSMHDTGEARKSIGGWKCQLSNTHIRPKNSCTYYR